jgi:hypothetical protein
MFGWSEETMTWAFWVDEKPRRALLLRRVKAVLLDRKAEASTRPFETLIAMVEGSLLGCQLQYPESVMETLDVKATHACQCHDWVGAPNFAAR